MIINSDTLKDLQPVDIGYSYKFFYVWAILKYGIGKDVKFSGLLEYGVSKRQVLRYLEKLESVGMVKRKKQGSKRTLIKFL